MFAHGSQKVLGWFGGYGLKATTGYFKSIGIPLSIGYAVCFIEFFSGIALILGLFTRLAALGVVAVMVGAILKVHLPNGFFMNWELSPGKGHGYETNLALIGIALACIIAGGGALSLDRLLFG
jgi:putative oxidoreductase